MKQRTRITVDTSDQKMWQEISEMCSAGHPPQINAFGKTFVWEIGDGAIDALGFRASMIFVEATEAN